MTLSIAVRLGKVAAQIRQRAQAVAKAVKAMATPMYKPYNRLLFSFMYLLMSAER